MGNKGKQDKKKKKKGKGKKKNSPVLAWFSATA